LLGLNGRVIEMKKTNRFSEIAFITPGLLVYTLFMIIPIVLCFYYSITNWDGISSSYRFIGLDNFKDMLSDDSFFKAVKATLWITIISTLIYNTIGILLAVILDQFGKAYRFSKSALFLPTILSGVVVSFIWSYMTQPSGGVINYIAAAFGMKEINFYHSWLATVLTVTGVITWAGLGFFTTVYLSALQMIPQELYEASKIDGAGLIRRFLQITMPLLTPGITISTILSLIWGLKQYDFVKVMAPGTVQTISINAIERAFEYNMFAYASSISLVLFLVIITVSIVQLNIMKKREVEY
jgi:ABC-type sugar transport system permease subunit